MSSGGQNGTSLAGLQGMRIRDASDVVTQTKLRLMFTTNNSANSKYSGVNAYKSKGNQNSYNFLLQVQEGLREWNGGYSSNVGMGTGIAWSLAPNANSYSTITTIPTTVSTSGLGTAAAGVSINLSNTVPTQ
jgi:hypothetical protein